MSLVRWRPTSSFLPRNWDIQNDVSRIFDHLLDRPFFDGDELRGIWSPSVDIAETENELIVTADLPGVNKDDIKVNVGDNVLTFSGERKREEKSGKGNLHRLERTYGSFSRSFSLSAAVVADEIKATYKDGVLRLTLPKVEEAKPRQIAVEVK